MSASPLIRRCVGGLLRQGLRVGRALSAVFLGLRVTLIGFTLRRRIARLERLQHGLRGRLVSVTAAAELSLARGETTDPSVPEREALRGSLIQLTRALAEARADRVDLLRGQVAARSAKHTGRAVRAMERSLSVADRFDTPTWEARHRLGADTRARATLAALRAGSPLLELRHESSEALGEGLGVPQE